MALLNKSKEPEAGKQTGGRIVATQCRDLTDFSLQVRDEQLHVIEMATEE